jgi:hypothetical protein
MSMLRARACRSLPSGRRRAGARAHGCLGSGSAGPRSVRLRVVIALRGLLWVAPAARRSAWNQGQHCARMRMTVVMARHAPPGACAPVTVSLSSACGRGEKMSDFCGRPHQAHRALQRPSPHLHHGGAARRAGRQLGHVRLEPVLLDFPHHGARATLVLLVANVQHGRVQHGRCTRRASVGRGPTLRHGGDRRRCAPPAGGAGASCDTMLSSGLSAHTGPCATSTSSSCFRRCSLSRVSRSWPTPCRNAACHLSTRLSSSATTFSSSSCTAGGLRERGVARRGAARLQQAHEKRAQVQRDVRSRCGHKHAAGVVLVSHGRGLLFRPACKAVRIVSASSRLPARPPACSAAASLEQLLLHGDNFEHTVVRDHVKLGLCASATGHWCSGAVRRWRS